MLREAAEFLESTRLLYVIVSQGIYLFVFFLTFVFFLRFITAAPGRSSLGIDCKEVYIYIYIYMRWAERVKIQMGYK